MKVRAKILPLPEAADGMESHPSHPLGKTCDARYMPSPLDQKLSVVARSHMSCCESHTNQVGVIAVDLKSPEMASVKLGKPHSTAEL